MGHPLVVSTETNEVAIGDVDFPQVTVSLPGGFNYSAMVNAERNFLLAKIGNDVAEDEFSWSRNDAGGLLQIIDQTCSLDTTYAGLNEVNNQDNNNFIKSVNIDGYHLYDDPTTKTIKERIIPFLKKATYNCGDVITGCFLNRKSINCGLLFKKRFSEWGGTCMFNGIPGPVTRKIQTMQSVLSLGEYTAEEIEKWSVANLDKDIQQKDERVTNKGVDNSRTPWRQTSPGRTSGLSFIIKDESGEKGSVHGEGTGFILTVAHPSDEPKIKRFGKSLPFGHEVFISITPILLLADDDIKKMEPDERGYYFGDDKGNAELKYYHKYTKRNCFEECISDAVFNQCNCTAFVAPEEMYDLGILSACQACLPNCRQTKYTISVTSSPLTQKHMTEYRGRYKEQLENDDTFSIVYVYFDMDSYQASRRSARYSTFEEVGLVGGTISMITGLTLLDLIEAIVVIAALIAAQHKIRTIVSSMEFNWGRFIPRLTWFVPPLQEMIELPVINVDPLDAQEIVDGFTIDVEPLEPQETVEHPIVISGQAGNPSPPLHPLEDLPGFIV
ncbi:pickpocket protein 28 [Folsomia candida]|uniref:pickpocket protein 28 n=1 Tax=Folsomia candida TaxID=158441 RepID=UPI000B8FCB24|nr:pickpocket protein 28 [Folsomia candida]